MATSIPTSPPIYGAASFDATPTVYRTTPSAGAVNYYVGNIFSTILVNVAAITFVALDGRDYWTT